MTNGSPNIPIDTIAETENYTIWTAGEPDGETTYHVELGPVTAHFFTEEWNDFVALVRETGPEPDADDDDDADADGDEPPAVEIELDWGSLYFTAEEWTEFYSLIDQV